MQVNAPHHIFCGNDEEIDSFISERLLTSSDAYCLADYCANIFLQHYHQTGKSLSGAISVLCRLATSNDADVMKAGLTGLFPLLIERLSDAFDPALCRLYDSTFSQVIGFCRRHPDGKFIDRMLDRFGLPSSESLFARKEALRNQKPSILNHPERYHKCILFSRVTLGAEVAITSIVLAKLLDVFPNAEVILIGDKAFADIFYQVPRFRVSHCPYPADTGLVGIMNRWAEAVAIVDKEIRILPESTYLIIDPDSRYTQLGLLPVIENEQYYWLFESRSFQHPGLEKISELTNCWLKLHLGRSDTAPFIRLSSCARHYARALRLKTTNENKIFTSVLLGVGGNNKKRLGLAFELALLKNLAGVKDNTILLFKGVGKEEIKRSEILLRELSASEGKRILHISGDDPRAFADAKSTAEIIAWKGPLSQYCALIAESDVHIGYDSSNQHIAAACGVPTIDIFADESTPMFSKRWAPYGPGPVKIVQAFDDHQTVASVDSSVDRIDRSLRSDGLEPIPNKRIEKTLLQTITCFAELLQEIRQT